jgi:ribonuclease HI
MGIAVYTDGACSGNPGIGGWGAIIIVPEKKPIYLHGGSDATTNNQMELTAAIKAFQYFNETSEITIYTDSKYVMNGIESWIINWKKNGWKTAAKKPVKNRELWEKLDHEIKKHQIFWQWVKGHAGNIHNEKADLLARKYIENR